ncbi:hypothetical protein KI387_003871, partial [Taxus chinensis]
VGNMGVWLDWTCWGTRPKGPSTAGLGFKGCRFSMMAKVIIAGTLEERPPRGTSSRSQLTIRMGLAHEA